MENHHLMVKKSKVTCPQWGWAGGGGGKGGRCISPHMGGRPCLKWNSTWAFFLPLPVPPGRMCSTTQQRRLLFFFYQYANPARLPATPPQRELSWRALHNSQQHNFTEPLKKATVCCDVKREDHRSALRGWSQSRRHRLDPRPTQSRALPSLFLHTVTRQLCPL